MPTITQIIANRAAEKAAGHPATAAMHAGNNALDQLRPLPDPDDPPPRQPATPPARVAPVPLPSPVKLIGEAAALARLFPALAAGTVGTTAQDSHAARAEWLRSTLPAAVAIDQGGAMFYPVAGVSALMPHAAALMAAEREEAQNARDLALGRAYRAARAAGASHAEAAAQLASMAG